MATAKPISTITYNTPDFLISTLNCLIYRGYLTYYEFIQHQPDNDDTKKHIHLYMIPAKSINLATFKNFFLEFDSNNDKPLCPTIFRNSIYGDWYWYALHNKDYLKSKGQERNISYSDKSIVCYDQTTHFQMVLDNPLQNFCKMSDMFLRDFVVDCVTNQVPLTDILKNKFIPLGKVQSVIILYNVLATCSEEYKIKNNLALQRALLLKNQKVENIILNLKELDNNNLPF